MMTEEEFEKVREARKLIRAALRFYRDDRVSPAGRDDEYVHLLNELIDDFAPIPRADYITAVRKVTESRLYDAENSTSVEAEIESLVSRLFMYGSAESISAIAQSQELEDD
jgi:hypothetical protein